MSGTKRTPVNRQPRAGLITPQVVTAYRHALELRAQHARGEVALDAVAEADRVVERMLGIRPWQSSVFDLDTFWEPGDPSYARAAELRAGLDTALAEARRQRATVTP